MAIPKIVLQSWGLPLLTAANFSPPIYHIINQHVNAFLLGRAGLTAW